MQEKKSAKIKFISFIKETVRDGIKLKCGTFTSALI